MSLGSVDIQGLGIATAIFCSFAIMGQQLDKFLLSSQNIWLRDKAAEWWNLIDDLKIRNFFHSVLLTFLKLKTLIFGKIIISFRLLFISLALSVTATFSVLLVGMYVYYGSLSKSINDMISNENILWLFPLNYFFDFLTLALTIVIIEKAIKASWPVAIALLVFDGALAFGIAIMCFVAGSAIEFPYVPSILRGGGIEALSLDISFYFKYYDFFGILDWRTSKVLLGPLVHPYVDNLSLNGGDASTWVFSNTTQLPTIGYIVIALIMFLAVVFLRVFRFICLQLLALSVETDKTVFFYTGAFIGFCILVWKLILEISKLVS